jgi:HEAT repeat protein
VRVGLTVREGTVRAATVTVGAERTEDGTDLGRVSAPEAARYLVALARSTPGRVGREAVLAAALADSVTVWPDLLALARDGAVDRDTRRAAVFWVGQAAEQAATRGLTDLLDRSEADREVQDAAVFALSQRPADEGVPALIAVARTHRDPEVRRRAMFWLGQSGDPRALAFFEELLTGS